MIVLHWLPLAHRRGGGRGTGSPRHSAFFLCAEGEQAVINCPLCLSLSLKELEWTTPQRGETTTVREEVNRTGKERKEPWALGVEGTAETIHQKYRVDADQTMDVVPKIAREGEGQR